MLSQGQPTAHMGSHKLCELATLWTTFKQLLSIVSRRWRWIIINWKRSMWVYVYLCACDSIVPPGSIPFRDSASMHCWKSSAYINTAIFHASIFCPLVSWALMLRYESTKQFSTLHLLKYNNERSENRWVFTLIAITVVNNKLKEHWILTTWSIDTLVLATDT